ncbi:MAG: hypothetical protein PUC15_06125 [Lentisphaeria bacterium]|nr:hypothetical protein [Lentisphaeria bacterium]
MKHPHFPFGAAFVFAGLLAALSLGVLGSCSLRAVPVLIADIDNLDAKARPHFDEASRNVPSVVKTLTEIGTTCKLCWLLARDKLAGAHETQEYLASVLEKPIITPCRKGAEVYGCDFNSAGFLDHLKAVNADYAEIEAYAISGLAIEAIFLKQTIAALTSTLGGIVARLSAAFGSGAACAAADGPFPFGDAVAVVLAAGGTAWSSYDLYQAQKQLPAELTALLKQAISDCQAACRMEVLK